MLLRLSLEEAAIEEDIEKCAELPEVYNIRKILA